VDCENQEEVDYYWERLGEGGDEAARQCGWLKDKYGLSWQIVPRVLPEMLLDPDPARARRAFAAMMDMRKLDIAALKRAFAGE
jgi:predicted 3-demethylubiquinone-9 3-methyltransferase (glyoxalase superfamily)